MSEHATDSRSTPRGERLLAGPDQPARRQLGIEDVEVGGTRIPVVTRDVQSGPFMSLVEIARADAWAAPGVLVVAPLSGHFSVLLRDALLALVADFRVFVTDWINVRHVSAAHGPLGFEGDVRAVHDAMRHLGPATGVVGLCQGGAVALAATALLAADAASSAPRALVLMGAPIDPLANPTRVVGLLRAHSLSWLERNVITIVAGAFAGHGRRVYPAEAHLAALSAYLLRHQLEGGELLGKVWSDDGDDPRRFPFLDLYTSVMDLDADYFLDNTRQLYHECALRAGALVVDGERVAPEAITETALMTVEGELDDIAAPGQTRAAHELCPAIASHERLHLLLGGSGHFSLFHGEVWRRRVHPAVAEFLRTALAHGRRSPRSAY